MNVIKKMIILIGIVSVLLFLSSFNLVAQEKLINLDVENANIEVVLKRIAHQSGFNIVISKNVIGGVTIKLENVSLEKALDAILETNNYLYTLEDNMINVFSYQDLQQKERFARKQTRVFSLQHADVLDLRRILLSIKTPRGKIELNPKNNQVIVTDTPDKVAEIGEAIRQLDQPTEIRKYKLLYANATDVQAKLLQVVPEEKGDIFVDERTNSVVIKATPIVLKNVDEFIKGWDVRHKQVLIEAKILEITLDEESRLGIDWQHQVDFTSEIPFTLFLKRSTLTMGALTMAEYIATLEALKSRGDTEILSSPRIVVIDGEEANILVGTSEPYIVAVTDPDTNVLIEEVKYVDVGIKLIVTPQIGEDNYITMKIHPEVSTAKRVLNDQAVQVITTEADTTMMVKDGETIILGGLIKNNKVKTVDKLPLLGDIPFLGAMFRRTVEEDTKTELVVFITPHILTDESRQVISEGELDRIIEKSGKAHAMLKEEIEKSIAVETKKAQEKKEIPPEDIEIEGKIKDEIKEEKRLKKIEEKVKQLAELNEKAESLVIKGEYRKAKKIYEEILKKSKDPDLKYYARKMGVEAEKEKTERLMQERIAEKEAKKQQKLEEKRRKEAEEKEIPAEDIEKEAEPLEEEIPIEYMDEEEAEALKDKEIQAIDEEIKKLGEELQKIKQEL